MCCDIPAAINVISTANSHNWSHVHSPMYLLLHLLHHRTGPNCFSPTQLSDGPLLYLKCAHACNLKLTRRGDVQDVGVGDMSSWRSLAHQQHNFSLCKKSVQVCFHCNDITLYKISRHFFICFVSRSNGHR